MSLFKKYQNIFIYIIFLSFAVLTQFEIFNSKLFFFLADWDSLANFKHEGMGYYSFFPKRFYDDRPIGWGFFNIEYLIFGLNHFWYKLTLLILHTINGFILFKILKIYLDENKKTLKSISTNFIPLYSSLIFISWPVHFIALSWNSAIYDILGTTLALSVIYIFKSKISSLSVINILIITTVYYITLRTKETFIILPFIILIFELPRLKKISRQKAFQLISIHCLAIIYFLKLFSLKQFNPEFTYPTHPRFISVNPVDITNSLITQLNFFILNRKLILVSLILIFTYVLFRLAKIKSGLILLLLIFVSIILSFSLILPLKNAQMVWYTYFPSIFISIFIGTQINFIFNKSKLIRILKFGLLILFIFVAIFSNNLARKDRWITHNETHQNLFITINSNKLNNQDQIYADLYIPKSLLSHEQSFNRMFQFVHNNRMFQLKTEINNSTNEITVKYPNKNEYLIKINYF